MASPEGDVTGPVPLYNWASGSREPVRAALSAEIYRLSAVQFRMNQIAPA